MGLAPGASQSRLAFTADLPAAVEGADLVQENGPERIDFKKKLYRQLDELLPADVIIASSSSGLTMSEIQSGCPLAPRALRHRAIRSIRRTWSRWSRSSAARRPRKRRSERAVGILHGGLGKQTVRLRKEVPGHVANRLQAALGAGGLLPRRRGRRQRRRRRHRAVLGTRPALGHHGQRDAQPPRRRPRRHRAFLPAVHRPYDGLVEGSRVSRELTPEVQKKLIDGVHAEVGSRSIAELEAERDEVLLGLLELRTKAEKTPARPKRLRAPAERKAGLDRRTSHAHMDKVTR